MNTRWTNSAVGPLTVWEADGYIVKLSWEKRKTGERTPIVKQALTELDAYFSGNLFRFTVPWRAGETDFQRGFLQALFEIPYGETRTYGDLAANLGVSAQSIGQACGANPIPVIVPCHRVLGAHGLGGFSGAGGVETKVELFKA